MQVQKGFIDMENMFDLLHTQPAVKNVSHSKPLNVRFVIWVHMFDSILLSTLQAWPPP